MEGLAGVTAIETSVAAVTESGRAPGTEPDVALRVVVPMLAPVARPLLPAALLTVAALVFDEAHVTESVRSCVVPLEYVPVAVNCWVVPAAMDGLAGVTAMETRVAAVT